MPIRTAEKKDFPVLLELMNEAIMNSTTIYAYEPRNQTYIENWFSEKEKNNFPVLVYEINGESMAFGSFGKFRTGDAYQFTVEHSIYVHRNSQNQGVGKKLLIALIEKAKKDRYHAMVGGIDAENQKSIEFHKKLGFQEVGRLPEVGFKFDRWLDLVFMQLLLTPV